MPSYLQAIAAAGGVPVMIPLGLSEADLREVIQQMDGILLPGGGNINPSVYHGDGHPTVGGIDEDRDRVELVVARTAVAQHKPLPGHLPGVAGAQRGPGRLALGRRGAAHAPGDAP